MRISQVIEMLEDIKNDYGDIIVEPDYIDVHPDDQLYDVTVKVGQDVFGNPVAVIDFV